MVQRIYYYQDGAPIEVPIDYGVVPPVQVTPRLTASASPVGTAVILALVADVGTGRILGEIAPQFRRISWLLNNYGEAEMVFAADDLAITSGLVSPGRRLMLQFDNGLPDWGGIIDVPIDRDGYTVSLRAYEATYLLKWRQTGRNVQVLTDAASLASALIAETSIYSPTGIEVGIVDYVDGLIETDYHYTPIWDVLTDDVNPYTEWVLKPLLSATGISFRMSIGPTIGRDVSNRVRLVQGINLHDVSITDQGPIINEWAIISNDGDWDAESATPREVATATDTESRYRYGLRQSSGSAAQGSTDSLQDLADASLVESAEPYQALSATALNLSPGLFRQYGIGDWITVELYSGFAGQELIKKVIGREFDVAAGTCEVILK